MSSPSRGLSQAQLLALFFMEKRQQRQPAGDCSIVAADNRQQHSQQGEPPSNKHRLLFPYLRSFEFVVTKNVRDDDVPEMAEEAVGLLEQMPFVESVVVKDSRVWAYPPFAQALKSKKRLLLKLQLPWEGLHRLPAKEVSHLASHCQQLCVSYCGNAVLNHSLLCLFTVLTKLDVSGFTVSSCSLDFCAATLEELRANYSIGLTDRALRACTKLRVLRVAYCVEVTTIRPFEKSLTELDASNTCGISDAGLYECSPQHLTTLNIANNPHITKLPPRCFLTLRDLNMSGACGVFPDVLMRLSRLCGLKITYNPFFCQLRGTELDLELQKEFLLVDFHSLLGRNGYQLFPARFPIAEVETNAAAETSSAEARAAVAKLEAETRASAEQTEAKERAVAKKAEAEARAFTADCDALGKVAEFWFAVEEAAEIAEASAVAEQTEAKVQSVAKIGAIIIDTVAYAAGISRRNTNGKKVLTTQVKVNKPVARRPIIPGRWMVCLYSLLLHIGCLLLLFLRCR